MAIYNVGDWVLVSDDEFTLEQYTNKVIAGKICKIISPDVEDGYTGYHVEFTSPRGFTYNYFVKADDIIPAKNPNNQIKKAAWERVADDWQKRLWKHHEEKEDKNDNKHSEYQDDDPTLP